MEKGVLDAMVLICCSTGSREILGYIPLVFGRAANIALGFASCDLTPLHLQLVKYIPNITPARAITYTNTIAT